MLCSRCLKIEPLCVCESIHPLSTQIHTLILQHPQEPRHPLGTARLAHLALCNSSLKIGLSWPRLETSLGTQTKIPSQWVVLYLGRKIPVQKIRSGLQFLSPEDKPVQPPSKVEGIVLLDGTWSQAKTLWWRNPWLLRLKRAVLYSDQPSLYRHLRREPRPECLSTLETLAGALVSLGEPETVRVHLHDLLKQLLQRYRQSRG